MIRKDIDVKKTVLLFVAIHLMIAWVAERKDKKIKQQSSFAKSAAIANKETRYTGIQYHLLSAKP